MPRVTLLDVKNSRIPQACGVAPNDSRLIQWLNEAQQRLIYGGRWWGTIARFNICATNGCITLPRQIASIERVNVCGQPVRVRDQWYEFLDNAWGSIDSQDNNNGGCGTCLARGMSEAIYRGHYPTFTDIKGITSKANFVCDLAADVGNRVLVLGYDQNGNWIRTIQNGSYADGEVITLAQSAGATSVNLFSTITDIQFLDAMDGQSWLYALDTSTSLLTMLGHYQYDEPHPTYARYFFPGLKPRQNTDGSCNLIKVEILAKLDYIPVVNDTDYLVIGNIPALKELMAALKKSENQADSVQANQIIAAGMTTAEAILNQQIEHMRGGSQFQMNVLSSSVGNVDIVPSFL